jgi:hypothetical protein
MTGGARQKSPERPPLSEPLAQLNRGPRTHLVRDLILPTLLFVALGGMTWAVRGSSGFGAWKGCIFAGVTWGAAWWYLAHDPRKEQSRRYASAWIVVALTFGIGIAGIQGWMQWPSLFEGKLMTDATPGIERSVPISRAYGFLWLFLAGAKWAGIGACFLAWCGSLRETRVWHWFLRIACGLAGAYFARFLIVHYPQHFVPLYDSIQAQYEDLKTNPNLRRMMNDCTEAVHHLGFVLGFLAFEIFRRDWKNVGLILTVAIVNGTGWALFQNWKWAPHVFPGVNFNFWRCWESSGGLSMGLAFGLAYFFVNRRMSEKERAVVASRRAIAGPNFEWLLIFLGLTWSLSIFFRFEVPWFLPVVDWAWHLALPERVAEWLQRDHLEWSAIFFAVVCAFGAAYYFVNRCQPIAAPAKRRSLWELFASIEWVGLLLTAALIVGLFLPIDQYAAWGRSLRINRAIDQLGELMLQSTSFLGPNHAAARARSAYSVVPVMQLYLACVMLVGIGWYFIRYRNFEGEKRATTPVDGDPNVERMGLYLGLLGGLGLSLQYGIKGWFNTYKYDERIWDLQLQHVLAPLYLVILLAITSWILVRPLPRGSRGNIFPHAAGATWLVLLVQNAIAQAITGPLSDWQELSFNIYYAVLFAITAVTVVHFQSLKKLET